MKVSFRSSTPPDALAAFVRAIWYFEGTFEHKRERIVPDGGVQLLVNLDADELRSYHGEALDQLERLGGAAVCGPFARPFGIDTAEQRRIVGVNFRPGGARPFLPVPVAALRDQHVELSDLWGRHGAVLRERLLGAGPPDRILFELGRALVERLAPGARPHPGLEAAVRTLHGNASVAETARRVGASTSALGRAFADHVGLSPKRYARLARFQRVVAEVAATPRIRWADLAGRHGYYDQAHLNRDFRELAGTRPSDYAARGPGDGNHIAIA